MNMTIDSSPIRKESFRGGSFGLKNTSMVCKLCAACSFESTALATMQTLLLTVDSQQIISLWCYGEQKTSPSSFEVSAREADSRRLLLSWQGGCCDEEDIRTSVVTCISMPQFFTIFIFYMDSKFANCCKLSFNSDALDCTISKPMFSVIREGKSGPPLPLVKSMVYIQSSRRIFLVTGDDSFYITQPIDILINMNSASSPRSRNESTDIKREELDDSTIRLSLSSTVNKSIIKHDRHIINLNFTDSTDEQNVLRCCKLPTLTTLNKTSKSFRSDDTVIKNIYVVECDTTTNIVILIESKSKLLMPVKN